MAQRRLLADGRYRAAGATFDLRAEEIRSSLAQTIAWCAGQQITATVEETEEVRRRRQMGEQASELSIRARGRQPRILSRLLCRDSAQSSEWQLDLHKRSTNPKAGHPPNRRIRSNGLAKLHPRHSHLARTPAHTLRIKSPRLRGSVQSPRERWSLGCLRRFWHSHKKESR